MMPCIIIWVWCDCSIMLAWRCNNTWSKDLNMGDFDNYLSEVNRVALLDRLSVCLSVHSKSAVLPLTWFPLTYLRHELYRLQNTCGSRELPCCWWWYYYYFYYYYFYYCYYYYYYYCYYHHYYYYYYYYTFFKIKNKDVYRSNVCPS